MPRRPSHPRYCLHKPSGQAVVFINRTQRYLGPYDSQESREEYAKVLTELARGSDLKAAQSGAAPPSLTVSNLLLKYFTEELPRFSRDEQHCQRCAIRILRQMFGETPVHSEIAGIGFGPLKLRLVRDAMVAGDPNAVDANGKPKPRKPWSRDFVNKQVKRIRAIFRWGVSWEIVPQTVSDALASLGPLKVGETEAVDYKPRQSVPAADITAVRKLLRQAAKVYFNVVSSCKNEVAAEAHREWTPYKSPADWCVWLRTQGRAAGKSSWQNFKKQCDGKDHPAHGVQQVRFLKTSIVREGLLPP